MRDLKTLIAMVAMVAALSACASTDVQKRSNAQISTAQDFTLPDQNGKVVTLTDILKDYRGAVLAFYPKDDSRN